MNPASRKASLLRVARQALRHPFLAVPFLFYYWSSAPGIGSSDTALIVDQMQRLDLSTHVNHHNLTLIAGWLFSFLPGAEPARLANLTCVFLGGVAVGLFYLLVHERSRSPLTAAVAATGLMVSHSMWWHSTVAEVYAMNAILVVIALMLLQSLERHHRDRALWALFFLAGLALFNHIQMGILAVAAGACLVGHVLQARRSGEAVAAGRLALGSAASFLVGLLPYAVTFVVDVVRRGSFVTAVSQALGHDFRSIMVRGGAGHAAADVAHLVVLQFPTPFLLAVGVGAVLLARQWRDSPALLALTTLFFLNTLFFAFYNTWDKFAFLLPSFIVLAYAASFAVERVVGWLDARPSRLAWGLAACAFALTALVPPFVYPRLVGWADAGGVFARYRHDADGNRLNLTEYAANPNKRRYREFETYIRALFERLPEGATYVDDDGRAYYPVRYFQRYRGWRADLRAELVNSWGFSDWGLEPAEFASLVRSAHREDRPLFLVSIREPYYGLITQIPGLDRLRFRRFPLEGSRWVYRLVTAAEENGLPPEPPVRPRLLVGRPPRGGEELEARDELGPGEPVAAVLLFDPNGEPFPLRFRWIPPSGGMPIENEPLSLPFGCASAWGTLDRPPPLPPGEWTVEARMGETVVSSASFRIRDGA